MATYALTEPGAGSDAVGLQSTTASERAASNAVQIRGANGYSSDYRVERFYRDCKGAVMYEGTREIHKLMQADYVLGFRRDKPLRRPLPKRVTDG